MARKFVFTRFSKIKKKSKFKKKKQYSDVLVNIFFENLVIMPSISAIFYLDGLSDIPKWKELNSVLIIFN